MIDGLIFPVTELITISILTEALVQILKGIISKNLSEQGKQIFSIAVSILLCTVLKVSLFDNVPQTTMWLGYALAGLIASRGSNFIHDLVVSIGRLTNKKK